MRTLVLARRNGRCARESASQVEAASGAGGREEARARGLNQDAPVRHEGANREPSHGRGGGRKRNRDAAPRAPRIDGLPGSRLRRGKNLKLCWGAAGLPGGAHHKAECGKRIRLAGEQEESSHIARTGTACAVQELRARQSKRGPGLGRREYPKLFAEPFHALLQLTDIHKQNDDEDEQGDTEEHAKDNAHKIRPAGGWRRDIPVGL